MKKNENHVPAITNRQVAEKNKSERGGKKRMNKKLIILPISALFVLMMAGLVSAATFNISSGDVLQGSIVVNITTNVLNASHGRILNCTFTGSSSSGEDTLARQFAHNTSSSLGTNDTTNVTLLTGNLMKDASDWTFSGTCYNSSDVDNGVIGTADSESITTVTGIVIDNGAPTCSFASGLKAGLKYPPTQTWTISCVNATSALIRFGSDRQYPMSEKADVCTFTGTKGTVLEGSYKSVAVATSDGLNSSSCSIGSVAIDSGVALKEIGAIIASGGGGKAAEAGAQPITSNKGLWLIVIIGAVAFYRMRQKKG